MILGMYLVGSLMNSKRLSRKIGANMTKGMLMPYKTVINRTRTGKEAEEKQKKFKHGGTT